MSYKALAPALLALVAGAGDAAAEMSLDSLSWLSGEWVRDTRRGEAVERWTRVSEDTMEGVAFVTVGDSTHVTESLRIERLGDAIFYVARPAENRFPTPFRMLECTDARVVFENPDYDFPQRIVYERDGAGGLTARIEGLVESEPREATFAFERRR
jgi:hypothetical protein